jgi:ligand-binding sensor protein
MQCCQVNFNQKHEEFCVKYLKNTWKMDGDLLRDLASISLLHFQLR